MIRHCAKWLCLFLFAGLAVGLPLVKGRPPEEIARWAQPEQFGSDKVVFLAGNLTDEDRITLTSALAGHPGIVLFDSHESEVPTEFFLKEFRPTRVIPVGGFRESVADLEERLHCKVVAAQPWEPGKAGGLWQAFFPHPHKVVICPAEPRRLLLQAACLAGAMKAPLLVDHGRPEDAADFQRCLKDWAIEDVYLIGRAGSVSDRSLPIAHNSPGSVKICFHHLNDEEAVSDAYLHQLGQDPAKTLVVANPEDVRPGRGGMSALAPMIALKKRALLVLTNPGGDNVEALVEQAGRQPSLQSAHSVILVGNLQAIPMQRRPNPMPEGRDRNIEMEPLTPHGKEPYSFAVGRLFHDDINVVALMLARPRLWQSRWNGLPRALVVSNPGGSLPLLETFSRNTAQELTNAGYQTTALFGHQARRSEIRKLLPKQTIFLWEGHHSTLVRDFEVPDWTEPLRPSLIFLQSCLALTPNEAMPFLRRGACGVIGSSSRTYSASGGALALAYCDALLYEHLSVGESLRHAKNYMLAFALLKEKRLGAQAKLGGATLRSAWAFTLWGDPTLMLPEPTPPEHALLRVRHHVEGNVIRIQLPDSAHEKATSGPYQTQMWANARLGGLMSGKSDDRNLRPLVFAEVNLSQVPPGKVPHLHGRLPGKNWVFTWDARRNCGSLLAAPRTQDRELSFHVRWD